jgi:hypothetical protein
MDTNGRELAFIRMDSRFKNCSHLAHGFTWTKRNPKEIQKRKEGKSRNEPGQLVFDIAPSDFGFVSGFGFRISDFSSWFASILLLVLCSSDLLGQTNPSTSDDLPPLRPPRAEILPTFWERHQIAIIVVAVLFLVLAFVGLWVLTRPKPPIIAPPGAKAREALNNLRNQPETGELLSKISQVIRFYFMAAFNLPQRELTTAEFSRMIINQENIGRTLADAVVEFLRQCDHRKFAPPAQWPPLGALDYAAKLIDEAENRRAVLLAEAGPQ